MKRQSRVAKGIFESYRIARIFMGRTLIPFMGIRFFKPNYIFQDRFDDQSVVADVGCGHEAEFSRYMVLKYGLKAYGVDPTRKHAPALGEMVKELDGKFIHLPLAVSAANGSLTFHESKENESGSILQKHINVQQDTVSSYEVETVTPRELVRRMGVEQVEFIKLDLEGAEFDLLSSVSADDLAPFQQIFIEFHDHCTEYTRKDARRIVKRIKGMGYRAISLDLHNYLFLKKS